AYGASGVAASISLGAWCCAAVLGWRGATIFGFSIDATARRRLPRIAMCAAAMGTMLFLAESFVSPVTATAGFLAQITILGGLVAAGVSFYGLLLDLLGVVSWGEAISNLRDGGLRE
ncbi:MAG TPA: murein biosynthesis integral membrane protein MurJ, partial [Afipia sp.]